MLAKKYLILTTQENSFLNDIGNGYNREFLKNGAIYIDYNDLYTKNGNKKTEELIEDIIKQNGIEVLIYHSEPSVFHFTPEFFQSLQKRVFTVMMLGDTIHYFDERDIYYAQCMDLVIVYDCLSRYRFQQYGVDAISFYSSYDKNKYFKINDMGKSINVSFVGDIAHKTDRKAYIDYMIKNGIAIEVFGTGSKNGQVTLDQMVEIFNKTKVNLNFTGLSSKTSIKKELNINHRLTQMKGRIAEIALCGGFVLSEYVPGIEEVFDINKEIVIFRNKEEMIEKIKYYLQYEDEREAIAKNGYVRALKDYGISTAIPKLINRIEEIRRSKIEKLSEVYLDSHFVKNYVTFRVKMVAIFIKARKWNLLFEEMWIILKKKKINVKNAIRFLLAGLFPSLKKLYLRLTLK